MTDEEYFRQWMADGPQASRLENELRPRLSRLLLKLDTHRTAVDQARRDLRQALDILENGMTDDDALSVVHRRIYEAGKQLAKVEQPK